jgi:hypothetical protein
MDIPIEQQRLSQHACVNGRTAILTVAKNHDVIEHQIILDGEKGGLSAAPWLFMDACRSSPAAAGRP